MRSSPWHLMYVLTAHFYHPSVSATFCLAPLLPFLKGDLCKPWVRLSGHGGSSSISNMMAAIVVQGTDMSAVYLNPRRSWEKYKRNLIMDRINIMHCSRIEKTSLISDSLNAFRGPIANTLPIPHMSCWKIYRLDTSSYLEPYREFVSGFKHKNLSTSSNRFSTLGYIGTLI